MKNFLQVNIPRCLNDILSELTAFSMIRNFQECSRKETLNQDWYDYALKFVWL